MCHPEAEHDALLLYHAPDARRRICSAPLQGKPIHSSSFWIALLCSRADPSAFAETVSKHFAVSRGSASGWHVAGVRWIANREVYKWIEQLRNPESRGSRAITRSF